MAILKCKMCGGNLEIQEGMTVCECEYCGSLQTVPQMDDEKKVTLFGRANRLRFSCEFDKASSVYESIVAEFPEEAEAYWGLVLCKYGIEYVDDPATGKKIPTCHRSSFDSVMDDCDFEQAMENSDSISRKVYREEAKQIEEIRKSIIEVSGKEEPYDVFICYKETDENGGRTIDSVIAQDVYDALTEKGYRVFFSRISLEDKLGQEYEPFIFAALNSAKLMLAFGTDYDYYNAVWVKNEWSRYLKLMTKDKGKYLIPCFKGIDAYDMPKEFAKLQSQDMGKVGATQDLLRGIEKLIGNKEVSKGENEKTVIQQVVSGGVNVGILLKRGFMNLEDRAFGEAQKCFDDVLSNDAECAEAYLGLLMAENKAETKEIARELFVKGNDVTQNRFWLRAKQFSSGELRDELQAWELAREISLQNEEDKRLAKEKAVSEKRKRLKQQLKELDTETIELSTEEYKKREALEEKYERLINNLSNEKFEYSKIDEQLHAINHQIDEQKKYLGTLGIFKAKEKKLVQKNIDEIEEQIKDINKALMQKKSKVDELQRDVSAVSDSINRFPEIVRENRKELILKDLGISDGYMTFGHYEQGKGNQTIEWKILRKDGSKLLVISKYALDYRQYHEKSEKTTWEECSLRKWLNQDFFEAAFTAWEKEEIMLSKVVAERNPESNIDPGNDVTDKIFLLSISEVEKYFKDLHRDSLCAPTDYVIAQGVETSGYREVDNKYTCRWLLRSPGYCLDQMAYVDYFGSVDYCGMIFPDEKFCIRPAMWIDLNV